MGKRGYNSKRMHTIGGSKGASLAPGSKSFRFHAVFRKKIVQECGTSAAVAVCWGGGVCPGGVSLEGCLSGWMTAWGVCLSRVCLPGGCLPRGVSAQAVSTQRGVSAQGVSARHSLPLLTEWQMPVKTLPCQNYVEDGKNWELAPTLRKIMNPPLWVTLWFISIKIHICEIITILLRILKLFINQLLFKKVIIVVQGFSLTPYVNDILE